MTATITHNSPEPSTAARWNDNTGGTWSWNGWGEWRCTVNGAPFCLKSWQDIPRRMFPMTEAR